MVMMTVVLATWGDVLSLGSRANLMLIGAVLVVAGALLRRRAARYSLTDMAMDAAWQTAKARGRTPTELESRVCEIAAERSNVRRARMVAGHAVRHVVGQVLGMTGLWAIVIGLVIVLLAWLWPSG